jgi:tRNA dimethylallyltransferase
MASSGDRSENRTKAAPILITGPTGSGKSAVALALAARLGGEIISVDSMQVYRGLDIGTAKPTPEDRARVPHHLIDVADLTDSFDAAHFVRLARAAVAEIQARDRWPIFCGGTGLYFKAYLEGLGCAPPADPRLRAELEATPLPELLGELERLDPPTFARIDRKNPRRVQRAVEVLRLTGKPFSRQRADWTASGDDPEAGPRVFGLARSPADLRVRIDARVAQMFARGLVAETETLLARGLEQNRTARQAIGYRQVIEHLRGVRSREETIALVRVRTWQFARRQMTWLRHQFRVTWLNVEPAATPDAVAGAVASLVRLPLPAARQTE